MGCGASKSKSGGRKEQVAAGSKVDLYRFPRSYTGEVLPGDWKKSLASAVNLANASPVNIGPDEETEAILQSLWQGDLTKEVPFPKYGCHIFVSSGGWCPELDVLVGNSFPFVRRICEEFGCDFTFSSMDWGVPGTYQYYPGVDHVRDWVRTRCLQRSIGPAFISIVHDTINLELKQSIPEVHFQAIVARLESKAHDTSLLHKWYVLNSNVVPARRELRAIDSQLSGYWHDEADQLAWMEAKMTLQRLVQDGAEALPIGERELYSQAQGEVDIASGLFDNDRAAEQVLIIRHRTEAQSAGPSTRAGTQSGGHKSHNGARGTAATDSPHAAIHGSRVGMNSAAGSIFAAITPSEGSVMSVTETDNEVIRLRGAGGATSMSPRGTSSSNLPAGSASGEGNGGSSGNQSGSNTSASASASAHKPRQRLPQDRLILLSSPAWHQMSEVQAQRYLDDVVQRCTTLLTQTLLQHFKRNPYYPPPYVTAAMNHHAVVKAHIDVFQGRESILNSILKRGEPSKQDDTVKPVVIWGAPGTGKSALAAKAAQLFQESHPGATVVFRQIGLGPETSSIQGLLYNVTCHIQMARGEQVDPEAKTFMEAMENFKTVLSATTDDQPLCLVLDELERLSPTPRVRVDPATYEWIPSTIDNSNVRLILTARSNSGDHGDEGDPLQFLRYYLGDASRFIEATPLSVANAQDIMNHRFEITNTTRTQQQQSELLNVFSLNRIPLFLRLLLDVTDIMWTSGTDVEKDPLTCSTVEELLSEFFDTLVTRHSGPLVARVVGYLTITRYSLSLSELEDILSSDDELLLLIEQYLGMAGSTRRIPNATLNMLFYDLRPLLHVSLIGRREVYRWNNRAVDAFVRHRYFRHTKIVQSLHANVAAYFSGKWAFRDKPYVDAQGRAISADRILPPQPYMFNTNVKNVRKELELVTQQLADEVYSRDVVLCYARSGTLLAQYIARTLRSHGLKVWNKDKLVNLESPEERSFLTSQAILACKAVVFISDDASLNSKECADEIALAYVYDKPIFPVSYGRHEPSRLEIESSVARRLSGQPWSHFLSVSGDPKTCKAFIKNLLVGMGSRDSQNGVAQLLIPGSKTLSLPVLPQIQGRQYLDRLPGDLFLSMPKHPSRVFISYIAADTPAAEAVAKALEASQFDTWMWGRKLTPGPGVLGRIGEELYNSAAVVMVVTSAALNSTLFHDEVTITYLLQKAVYPVAIGEQAEVEASLPAHLKLKLPPMDQWTWISSPDAVEESTMSNVLLSLLSIVQSSDRKSRASRANSAKSAASGKSMGGVALPHETPDTSGPPSTTLARDSSHKSTLSATSGSRSGQSSAAGPTAAVAAAYAGYGDPAPPLPHHSASSSPGGGGGGGANAGGSGSGAGVRAKDTAAKSKGPSPVLPRSSIDVELPHTNASTTPAVNPVATVGSVSDNNNNNDNDSVATSAPVAKSSDATSAANSPSHSPAVTGDGTSAPAASLPQPTATTTTSSSGGNTTATTTTNSSTTTSSSGGNTAAKTAAVDNSLPHQQGPSSASSGAGAGAAAGRGGGGGGVQLPHVTGAQPSPANTSGGNSNTTATPQTSRARPTPATSTSVTTSTSSTGARLPHEVSLPHQAAAVGSTSSKPREMKQSVSTGRVATHNATGTGAGVSKVGATRSAATLPHHQVTALPHVHNAGAQPSASVALPHQAPALPHQGVVRTGGSGRHAQPRAPSAGKETGVTGSPRVVKTPLKPAA